MQSLDLAQVLSRIEAAAIETPHGIIAFDADGTLWSGDVGEDFFHALIARKGIRDDARDALMAEAKQYQVKIELGAMPTDIAQVLYNAYVEGKYPEERTCEMMTWACAGWSHAEIEKHCRGVVEVGRLTSRIHEEAYAALTWARERGIRAVIVSASPREVVELAAAKLGFSPEDVIAATASYEEGKLTTHVDRPIPYAEGKVTALRRQLGNLPLLAAFGDNAFDLALLSLARVAVAVRPKERLRSLSSKLPSLVELAQSAPATRREEPAANPELPPKLEAAVEDPPVAEGPPVHMRLRMISAGQTDIGRGRKHNEDMVLVRRDLELYIVADGAGGHNAGNVASAVATTSMANAFETTADQLHDRPDIDNFGLYVDARRLASAIHKANTDVVELAKSSQRFRGMGTTVVAAAPSL
ncbi:MAG: HAD-IB family phosphatase, partial [Polyangiaceae bacterium]